MDDIEQSHQTNEHISAKQWRSSTRYILMLNDKLHSTVCWFHKTCIARWTTNECTIRLLTLIFPSIVTTYTMLERTNSRVGVENYRKKCTMWCDKVCRIRGIARNSQARNINVQQAPGLSWIIAMDSMHFFENYVPPEPADCSISPFANIKDKVSGRVSAWWSLQWTR